jgi:hypothetical protein
LQLNYNFLLKGRKLKKAIQEKNRGLASIFPEEPHTKKGE